MLKVTLKLAEISGVVKGSEKDYSVIIKAWVNINTILEF